MTIGYREHQTHVRRGIITAYIDYFDDAEPDKILKRKCFQAKTIEEIYVKIEEASCGMCGDEKNKTDLKEKLNTFCKAKSIVKQQELK